MKNLFRATFDCPQDAETTLIYIVTETWQDAIEYATARPPKAMARLIIMEQYNRADEQVWVLEKSPESELPERQEPT